MTGAHPRIWETQVLEFLRHKRATSEVGEAWITRMKWELNRFPELVRRIHRDVVLRSAKEVTGDHVRALREGLPWETPTFAIHFQALRQFLRWTGNPIAEERSLWALPTSTPIHRRWLTKSQLIALYRRARGVERVIVALEGLSGLRRVEVLRLRVKDILVNEGCLRILGKGRRGGKWRNIPLHGEVLRVLKLWVRGRGEEDRVVALSRSGADAALQRAARRAGFVGAGIRVSHHDLRRTFGRMANASGMSLLSLQGLYGHTSPALSAHYIGLDFDDLKRSLVQLDSYLGPLRDSPRLGRSRPHPRAPPSMRRRGN